MPFPPSPERPLATRTYMLRTWDQSNSPSPPVTRVPPVGTICVAVHFCFDDLTCKQGPARTLPLVALDLIRSDMLDPNNKYAILDRRFAEMSPRTVEEAEAATVFSGAALYLLG